MRRLGLIWLMCLVSLSIWADGLIDIPLQMYTVRLAPMDNPTTSTPDPTDPNQFRATLIGNTLSIQTQQEAVSYVVVQSDFSEKAGEDYFFALSTNSVTCTINRPGIYTIRIGHWNTDFVGVLDVESMGWYDFNGRYYGYDKPMNRPGYYFIYLKTNIGNTFVKYLLVQ